MDDNNDRMSRFGSTPSQGTGKQPVISKGSLSSFNWKNFASQRFPFENAPGLLF